MPSLAVRAMTWVFEKVIAPQDSPLCFFLFFFFNSHFPPLRCVPASPSRPSLIVWQTSQQEKDKYRFFPWILFRLNSPSPALIIHHLFLFFFFSPPPLAAPLSLPHLLFSSRASFCPLSFFSSPFPSLSFPAATFSFVRVLGVFPPVSL